MRPPYLRFERFEDGLAAGVSSLFGAPLTTTSDLVAVLLFCSIAAKALRRLGSSATVGASARFVAGK